MSLPFLERLGIPKIIEQALCKTVPTANKLGCTYMPVDILMALLLGFLLKCHTFEDINTVLGEHKNLGIWIGKKRLPSINVIKKRVQEFVTPDLAKELKQLLAQSAAAAGIVDLGVLYIDAHFITYYGKDNISKGYSTIRRLALRGIYHHFVGDRRGWPVIFYLTNGSVRLHRTLPMLVKDVQELRRQYDPGRPLFLIFDREVYDAKLFERLDREQVVFLTYMKNASEYPDENFTQTITVQFRTKLKKYELFATYTSIPGYHERVKTLVVRDPKNKRQSAIITNCDRVAFRGKHIRPRNETLVTYMLNRWGQENFFKRAVNELNIDHSFGYRVETCSPQPKIDNPEIKELQKHLAKLKKDREKTQSQIASLILKEDKTLSLEELAKTKPKLKELLQEQLRLVREINACQAQIDVLPKKVDYSEAFPQKQPRKACNLVKKDLLDTLKIMAFFVDLLMEEKFRHCHRNKRTLVPTLEKLLSHPTDLVFWEEKGVVRFHPFYFPSHQRSAQNFCHNLNLKGVRHPCTKMPILFEAQEKAIGVK